MIDERILTPHSRPGELIPGLYDPDSGKVACVLIHAAHGIRDRRVNRLFDEREWFVAPKPNMVLMNCSLEDWQLVESMPREERPNLRGGKIKDQDFSELRPMEIPR